MHVEVSGIDTGKTIGHSRIASGELGFFEVEICHIAPLSEV
jgi:hypothetical protein